MQPTILCLTSYEKGQQFLREVALLGCRVELLTVDTLRDADWPHDILSEFHLMPAAMSTRQIVNTVTWLARTRRFDRIVALDEFDMETAAALREHMRIPGMGLTTTHYFRDKLAMRTKAAKTPIPGLHVPEFTGIFNYEDVAKYMADVPGPWLLKPRADASAIGIRKIYEAAELWPILDTLGDRQSFHLLERFVPGEIYHVDGIVQNREVVLAAVHKYGKPPMQVMHEGGVFTTRTLDPNSDEATAMLAVHKQLIPALGLVRGVTHTEFIRAAADGRFYFLETAARVGGAFIADVMQHACGINPWVEWARIEVASIRAEEYQVPKMIAGYAGSVLCLAGAARPDTSAYQAPEIVYRMNKDHHAGLIVRSEDPARVHQLLEEYSGRFLNDFCVRMPVPDRPTS